MSKFIKENGSLVNLGDEIVGQVILRNNSVVQITAMEIRVFREAWNLSQESLARSVRVSLRSITRWESGNGMSSSEAVILYMLMKQNPAPDIRPKQKNTILFLDF